MDAWNDTTDILEAQDNKDDPEKLSAEFILSTIKQNPFISTAIYKINKIHLDNSHYIYVTS
ncbi:MAG: hypothetical protein A2W22_01840 [Candidatus Levybacteria bacterium RBG_16_35_11]|nr:MAG: hypothetical protein A2W22_01840 [Candidatus Levybacteria bacterium RBG_16_35_11]